MKKQTKNVPDRRYLLHRAKRWYVRYPIPIRLRELAGKVEFVETLRTSDFNVARERRWDAIERFRRKLRDLEATALPEHVRIGLEQRKRYLKADPEPPNPDEEPSNDNLSEREGIKYEIVSDVDVFRSTDRPREAALLYWTCFGKVESGFGFTRPASRTEAGS